MSVDDQPISHVEWVPIERLHANEWNPNKMAPPETRLLKVSILEDGWTSAIVARAHDDVEGDLEVVDGFHRWTLAKKDKQVQELTGALVPIVPLLNPDPAHRRMSTIRHNRARGTHHVVKMADIVADLATEMNVPADEIMRRLGMDSEEVQRLLDRGQMTKRGANPDGLGEAWRPAPVDRENPPPGSRLNDKEAAPT